MNCTTGKWGEKKNRGGGVVEYHFDVDFSVTLQIHECFTYVLYNIK